MTMCLTMTVRYEPTWDRDGRCWVVWWMNGELQKPFRQEEADKDADPADWWKRGGTA